MSSLSSSAVHAPSSSSPSPQFCIAFSLELEGEREVGMFEDYWNMLAGHTRRVCRSICVCVSVNRGRQWKIFSPRTCERSLSKIAVRLCNWTPFRDTLAQLNG